MWRVYRKTVKHKLANRCDNCGISERIVALDNGLCEICQAYIQSDSVVSVKEKEEKYIAENKAISEKISRYIGKGRYQYDALLYFSGGKDSIYLLMQLLEKYKGLRILAFTVDNGFRSAVAKENTQKICEYFQVDHVEVSAYKVFKKLYRYGFTELSHKGFMFNDLLEGELFQDIGRHFAASQGIPLLMLGYTDKQINNIVDCFSSFESVYPKNFFLSQQEHHFTRRLADDICLDNIFDEDEMLYWWDSKRYAEECLPAMIYPLCVWDYDREEVINTIKKLNIIDSLLETETNDEYLWLGIYIDYRIFGYTHYEKESSQLVREGKAKFNEIRDAFEMMEYLSLYKSSTVLKQFSTVLKKLNLTNEDVECIVKTAREVAGTADYQTGKYA